ncbi:MAG: carboxypeptidase-like regulatory domain-containing protein, partial [Planctomycetes bacterium]|nr:carboxypeptidase-like regulatory domain-containing protein [Planctomycetota bacterium]
MPHSQSAELVRLTPENWDEYAPQGKEVDRIYGDYVMRNDRIIAVIAQPVAGRNANMTVQGVRGAVIDLTLRDAENDQLSAFYPTAARFPLSLPAGKRAGAAATKGDRVTLTLGAEAAEGQPAVTVVYELADGSPALAATTVYENPHDKPLEVELVDAVRADRSFTMNVDQDRGLFWAYDEWWKQAYGVMAEDHAVKLTGGGRPLLHYEKDGAPGVLLAPQQKHALVRRVFPAENTLDLLAIADELRGKQTQPATVVVNDEAGPIAGAFISFSREGNRYGQGRTDEEGRLATRVPAGSYEVAVEAVGRAKQTITIDATSPVEDIIEMEQPGYVTANVTDDAGNPIPCKVAFRGVEGTPDPNWGPDTFIYGVQNLRYTPNGRFRTEIAPGKYRVAVSYGPEYDAVFAEIDVLRGQETNITATLRRVVDTRGWVSSDFHS